MRYLNIRNGKFTFTNKKLGSQIEAKIKLVGKRLLQWGPTGLVGEQDCYNEAHIPDGWTLAYDLDLLLDDVHYRLTLHGGSIQYAFKPYLCDISSRNLTLEYVVTRISIEDSGRGYPALKFELVS